jgi:hypothetical protein
VSTTFPRTLMPSGASWPRGPGGLLSWSIGGVGQARDVSQKGRSWTEEWPPLLGSDPAVQGFLAKVADYWSAGTVLTIQHPSRKTLLGIGTGTPKVKGANQTGRSLVTDGWTATQTGILKAGDLITLASWPWVLEVPADCNSDGSGNATIPINPGILAGWSPADNADLVVTNAAVFTVLIAEEPNWPTCPPDEFYVGFKITFREAGSV